MWWSLMSVAALEPDKRLCHPALRAGSRRTRPRDAAALLGLDPGPDELELAELPSARACGARRYTATTTVLARYDEESREQAESAGRGGGFSGEPSASGVVERGETPLRLRNPPLSSTEHSLPEGLRLPFGQGERWI